MNSTEHLLVCLMEECAEVQKAASKALRFGLDDGYPGSNTTNGGEIARELIDLQAIIELLEESLILVRPENCHTINSKKDKVKEWMEYSKECGALTT